MTDDMVSTFLADHVDILVDVTRKVEHSIGHLAHVRYEYLVQQITADGSLSGEEIAWLTAKPASGEFKPNYFKAWESTWSSIRRECTQATFKELARRTQHIEPLAKQLEEISDSCDDDSLPNGLKIEGIDVVLWLNALLRRHTVASIKSLVRSLQLQEQMNLQKPWNRKL